MAEYIDREALLEQLDDSCKYAKPTNDFQRGNMIQRIEFTNQPPMVADCPEMALRLLARELVEATRKHKQQQKKEKNYGKCYAET